MDEATKGKIRPMLAGFSMVALIWFYTLMVFGNDIPLEINSFWIPILWFFRARDIEKRQAKENK